MFSIISKFVQSETQKSMILYFLIGGLKVLNSLDSIKDIKDSLIDWIYS